MQLEITCREAPPPCYPVPMPVATQCKALAVRASSPVQPQPEPLKATAIHLLAPPPEPIKAGVSAVADLVKGTTNQESRAQPAVSSAKAQAATIYRAASNIPCPCNNPNTNGLCSVITLNLHRNNNMITVVIRACHVRAPNQSMPQYASAG